MSEGVAPSTLEGQPSREKEAGPREATPDVPAKESKGGKISESKTQGAVTDKQEVGPDKGKLPSDSTLECVAKTETQVEPPEIVQAEASSNVQDDGILVTGIHSAAQAEDGPDGSGPYSALGEEQAPGPAKEGAVEANESEEVQASGSETQNVVTHKHEGGLENGEGEIEEEEEDSEDEDWEEAEDSEEEEEMRNMEDLVRLPKVDEKRARAYSSEKFGELLLVIQWGLRHRIKVCQALQDPENHWIMAPLSRHEYAKQSLALIDPTATPLEDVSSSFPSFRNWSSESKGVEQLRSKLKDELPEELEERGFKKWEQLTSQLEAKLKSVRESDKKQAWYSAFEREDLKPRSIYNAVEQGNVESFVGRMREIGKEQWGSIKPGEYRGATPLHWALLYSNHAREGGIADDIVRFMRGDGIEDECGDIRDEFGFAPVHMAIFSSSFPKFLPEH